MRPRDLAAEGPFNAWTPLHRVPAGRHAAWLCRCECGTERAVLTSNLVWGKSKSCGCRNSPVPVAPCPTCGDPVRQKARASSPTGRQAFCGLACFRWSVRHDRVGDRVGRLTVVRCAGCRWPRHRVGSGGYRWLCKCECGNATIVDNSCLRPGGTISCGCAKVEAGFAARPTQPPPREVACEECGRVRLGSRLRRFCSRRCMGRRYLAPLSVVACPVCGNEVTRRGNEPNLYCSDDCYRKAEADRGNPLAEAIRLTETLTKRLEGRT